MARNVSIVGDLVNLVLMLKCEIARRRLIASCGRDHVFFVYLYTFLRNRRLTIFSKNQIYFLKFIVITTQLKCFIKPENVSNSTTNYDSTNYAKSDQFTSFFLIGLLTILRFIEPWKVLITFVKIGSISESS